jgi:glycosyltransferase involved in cell wall biosynthesis
VRVSIVATLYNSAPFVEEFFRRSVAAVAPVADEIEVVFVDDGSPDDAGRRARALASPGVGVKVVELSRNFGHFQAVMAGLGHADGDLVYLLDVDLEEAPELFADLYAPIAAAAPEDPVDVAFGVARNRKGGTTERLGGALFYRLINALSHVEIPVNALMARVMTRRYVDALLTHRERERRARARRELPRRLAVAAGRVVLLLRPDARLDRDPRLLPRPRVRRGEGPPRHRQGRPRPGRGGRARGRLGRGAARGDRAAARRTAMTERRVVPDDHRATIEHFLCHLDAHGALGTVVVGAHAGEEVDVK